MGNVKKIQKLKALLKRLYLKNRGKLLFHGWHHITFVSKKASEFAESIVANIFLAESAALVHDLNYLVRPNSEPEVGYALRRKVLLKAGYANEEIGRIETIVMESHTRTRSKTISKEGKALSDGDTLFKALPTTPILFASKYMAENNVDIKKWAQKIVSEQIRLMKTGIYFYTPLAKKKYLKWAKVNLALCSSVDEAMHDNDVSEMISLAKKLRVL